MGPPYRIAIKKPFPRDETVKCGDETGAGGTKRANSGTKRADDPAMIVSSLFKGAGTRLGSYADVVYRIRDRFPLGDRRRSRFHDAAGTSQQRIVPGAAPRAASIFEPWPRVRIRRQSPHRCLIEMGHHFARATKVESVTPICFSN